MIRIQDTKNMIGITIHGDYEDLKTLHHALSDYLRFYFDHQDGKSAYSCYENILGLCYDIRHAYQGDRNIETVENNHENIARLAECIYQLDEKSIEKERKNYKNGNLYFNVEVLYPWAVYYLYALQAVTDDIYKQAWFQNDNYGYTEYQAESDLALIQYFVQLLWNRLRENLPENVMKTVWDYTRIFNHVEYYFIYPDIYMEWLCTYWVKIIPDKKQRKEMLPLLCLELSSILDEDPDDLEEQLIEENCEHNKKAFGQTEDDDESDDDRKDTADEGDPFRKQYQAFQSSLARNTLAGLALYDEYAQKFHNNPAVPYQSMDEFLEIIYDYVDDHGRFTEESYEKWLDQQLGRVDWDRIEW